MSYCAFRVRVEFGSELSLKSFRVELSGRLYGVHIISECDGNTYYVVFYCICSTYHLGRRVSMQFSECIAQGSREDKGLILSHEWSFHQIKTNSSGRVWRRGRQEFGGLSAFVRTCELCRLVPYTIVLIWWLCHRLFPTSQARITTMHVRHSVVWFSVLINHTLDLWVHITLISEHAISQTTKLRGWHHIGRPREDTLNTIAIDTCF